MPIIKDVEKVNGQDIEIYVEVDDLSELPVDEYYDDTRDAKEIARQALTEVDGVFGAGLRLAKSCAVRTADVLLKMDEAVLPDEFEVQIAVKLDAGVPTLVQTGGHLQLTMKWKENNGKGQTK